MAGAFESLRKWVVEHQLRTIGYLWLGSMAGAIANNCSQPSLKTIRKIMEDTGDIPPGGINYSRVHPETITLVALIAAIAVKCKSKG